MWHSIWGKIAKQMQKHRDVMKTQSRALRWVLGCAITCPELTQPRIYPIDNFSLFSHVEVPTEPSWNNICRALCPPSKSQLMTRWWKQQKMEWEEGMRRKMEGRGDMIWLGLEIWVICDGKFDLVLLKLNTSNSKVRYYDSWEDGHGHLSFSRDEWLSERLAPDHICM